MKQKGFETFWVTPVLLLLLVVITTSCRQPKEAPDPKLLTADHLVHNHVDQLTKVIIHDAFSPPVASRIYAYTSIAAYEALRFSRPGYPSIAAQLHAFAPMPQPQPGKSYNYLLAATKAFFTVAEKVTFSTDTLHQYQARIYDDFAQLLDKETYDRTLAFGEAIGKKVLERTTIDNYKETRGMDKFLGENTDGKWRPTAPDYLDAAEPYWALIKPLAIDSASQFPCPAPLPFSKDTNSQFFKNTYEVYQIGKNLTDEQIAIAKYWDDNPFVMEHSGHMMFANKKITPVGHWIGIAAIASKMKALPAVEAAQVYALTATAIFDSFICCWEEKYRTQVVRPITVIHDLIDRNWQPLLQTPPFPEYTSGHSGISAAAASVLTARFGDGFAFEDTSDLQYIGMKRSFASFRQAAEEASISRVYGGIHYRTGVEVGALQGNKIGAYINNKIRLKE